MPLPQTLATLKDSLVSSINNQQLSFPSPGVASEGLNWILQNVFPADSNAVTVTSASVIETAQPSVQLACAFQLFGTVSFNLTFTFTVNESNSIETTLEAVYPADNAAGSLKLGDILSKLHVNIPVVPGLIISSLKLSVSKEFFGIKEISFGNTWIINIGANNLEVSQLALTLGYGKDTGFSGSLQGNITIGTASFGVLYKLPGDFEVNGLIPSIDFKDLVNSFSTASFSYPGGFPSFTLNAATFKINKTSTNYEVNVDVADVNGWGELEVNVRYVNQQWGFAAGFALHPYWNLSQISSVFNPVKNLSFAKTGLIVASYADTGFAFKKTEITLPKKGIVAGINVFGDLQFPADTKSPTGVLGKLIGKQGATLEIMAQIPVSGVSNSKFAASLGGSLSIPSAASASSFTLKNPSLFITAQPSFGISGTLNIPVKGQTFPIDGELVVSTTEIGFNAYANTANLKNPVGFNGVTLEGVGVSLDLEIETMACALALEGVFNLAGKRASRDQVAFKFAVAPEAAYPVYLVASFDFLDLPTIYQAVMNPGKSLPPELSAISFQKLLIYWADQPGSLPDGTLMSPGFRFNAQPAKFFGFEANAAVMMDFNKGFSGNLDVVKPIMIKDIVKVTKAGDAGRGPQVAVNTLASPYLQASVDATLFKMASTSVTAMISSKALTLDIKNTINGFLDSTINLQVSATSPNYYFAFISNLNLTLSFDVSLPSIGGMNIGTLRIKNTGFKGALTCHLDPKGFNLTMTGGILWEGRSWNMPDVVVTAVPPDLSAIPDTIRRQWTDKGSAIFSGIVSSMDGYLTLIKDGVLTGGESMSKVLMGVFSVRPDHIVSILKGYGLHESITLPVSYTGHVDTQQHLDTPSIHGDTPAIHIDTKVLHWDTTVAHVDSHTKLGHWDTGGQHTDSGGHTDTNQPPHGDGVTIPHVDTTQHLNTPSAHIDESMHIDV